MRNEPVKTVHLLGEHSTDPTVQDKDGQTPLHVALRNGHVQIVHFLVEHGTDPTAQDKDGWTPLHKASLNGHVEIVHFLVEHGADLGKRKGNPGVFQAYPDPDLPKTHTCTQGRGFSGLG